jgi:integrase/recombinase XerD
MLEQYFLRPTTVDRIRSNWLGPQIERYVEWMHAQKYAQRNITRRVALLCHFADFARANGATDHHPSMIQLRIAQRVDGIRTRI